MLTTKKILNNDIHTLFPDLLTSQQHAEVKQLQLERNRKKLNSGKKTKTKDAEELIFTSSADVIEQAFADKYGEDFDILSIINAAEDPVTGVIRDLKVDDRDLPQASNFYDFAHHIIGRDSNPPWSRQLWTGAMLFGEVCPCCSNKKWLDIHNVPKDYPSKELPEHLVFLVNGKCPKCKRAKWELIQDHGLRNYQQLVNLLGQRSGKSSSAAYYSAYLAHRYLKFPHLSTVAPNMMQASTELTGTFVSLTTSKAIGVLWTPFKQFIQDSTWFQDYFKMLDHYGKKNGRELYKDNSLELRFMHKNIRFYPTGPRSTTLRGDTRILGVLDELGLFPLPSGDAEEDEQSERANADEAHKSLSRSLSTVQGIGISLLKKGQSSAPPALMLNVSSPISQRDKMMRLLRESRTEEGKIYTLGIQLPTWEVNPGFERDSPMIVMAYNENKDKAERDYGANPPATQSQFIQSSLVERDIFVNGQNSHNMQYQYDVEGEIYAKVTKIRTFNQPETQYQWPSLLTIDAGYSNNSFCITGGHYDFKQAKPVLTTVIEVMPHEGRVVNFNKVYSELILPIARDLNAVGMVADQWNSLDILSRLQEDMGLNKAGKTRCKCTKYSPKRKDFDVVVQTLKNKNYLMPTISDNDMHPILNGQIADYRTEMFGKPVQHLLLQMLTVQELGETRCPGKGEGYTDDIFRSFVLWGSLIFSKAVLERLKEALPWNYGGSGGSGTIKPFYVSRGGMR